MVENWRRFARTGAKAHLSDDVAVAKMGHRAKGVLRKVGAMMCRAFSPRVCWCLGTLGLSLGYDVSGLWPFGNCARGWRIYRAACL